MRGGRKRPGMATAEIRDTVRRMYGQFPPKTIAELCGVTPHYIRCIASALGLKACGCGPNWSPFWTDKECEQLRREYGSTPVKVLAERFGRSARTVMHKASKMGLGRRSKPLWEQYELEFVRDNYPAMKASDIATELGRSINAVRDKIGEMGLTGSLKARRRSRDGVNEYWRSKGKEIYG